MQRRRKNEGFRAAINRPAIFYCTRVKRMTPSRVYVAMQSRPRWNQKPNTGPHCTLGLVSVAVFQTKPTYHQAAMAQHNCIEQVQRTAGGVSIICQDDHCRSVCKNCGGASICPHTRGRSGLRGASICQHSARAAGAPPSAPIADRRQRCQCKDCKRRKAELAAAGTQS